MTRAVPRDHVDDALPVSGRFLAGQAIEYFPIDNHWMKHSISIRAQYYDEPVCSGNGDWNDFRHGVRDQAVKLAYQCVMLSLRYSDYPGLADRIAVPDAEQHNSAVCVIECGDSFYNVCAAPFFLCLERQRLGEQVSSLGVEHELAHKVVIDLVRRC